MSLTDEDLYPVDNDEMAESLSKIRNITVSILEKVDDAYETYGLTEADITRLSKFNDALELTQLAVDDIEALYEGDLPKAKAIIVDFVAAYALEHGVDTHTGAPPQYSRRSVRDIRNRFNILRGRCRPIHCYRMDKQ